VTTDSVDTSPAKLTVCERFVMNRERLNPVDDWSTNTERWLYRRSIRIWIAANQTDFDWQ